MPYNGMTGFKKGQSGNPNGRPPRPEIQELREALEKAKKESGVGFIDLFVRKAYKNEKYALALANKIMPELKSIDFGDETIKAFQALIGVRVLNEPNKDDTADSGNSDQGK